MTVVTCGDAAAGRLRAAGLADDVIVWRDILHEGPVPGGIDLDELTAVRARFLASMGWNTEQESRADLLARNARLRTMAGAEPVTLWFDDNLVNQLQLIQILAELSTLDVKDGWLAGPHTFGGVPAGELRARHDKRRPLTQAHLDLATRAWRAFRADQPPALAALASQPTDPLPALGAALIRQLRQFPGTRDGLGLTERRALEAVAAGLTGFVDIFIAHAAAEDPAFLGDTTLWHYLERLAQGRHPLLEIDGTGRYRLTGYGMRVLDGAGDQIELNGIDRWYGGVHLIGRSVWRWDEECQAIAR
jgi:hypothetical protein